MRTVWLGLLSGCIFGGGKVDAADWPKRASRATCNFTKECAESAFYVDYTDNEQCRETHLHALNEEAAGMLADECIFDTLMADACLDALGSSCEDAGAQSETIFEPCLMVWNCDGSDPAPATDTF